MSSLGKNGVFSSVIDLTSKKRKYTTTNNNNNNNTTPTKKRKYNNTTSHPAKKFTSAKAKTNNKGLPQHNNLNIKRSLPQTFQCNGKIVSNQFKPSVTASDDVEYVTAHFSSYSFGSNGICESNLVKSLVSTINKYGKGRTVVGCVAWLSNKDILQALKGCGRVLLIINREDYTKWGGGGMLKLYKELPPFDVPLHVAFTHLDSVLGTLETGRVKGKSKYACVRAFGNSGFKKTTSKTTGAGGGGLEHCKYLIFFENKCFKRYKGDDAGGDTKGDKNDPNSYDYTYKEIPCAVWTGSMNMTKASETNHENAVFIKSTSIATSFFHDFSNTFMVSTPVSSLNKSKSNTPSKYISLNW